LLVSSRPTRARGLKQKLLAEMAREVDVAPHAGAWIETDCALHQRLENVGRAPRGRVD